MSSISQNHAALFNRLLEGKLSPGDTEALIAWLGSEELEPHAVELIAKQLKQSVIEEQVTPGVIAALEARLPLILAATQPAKRIPFLKRTWVRYAAAIIVLLGTGAYLLFPPRPSQQLARVDRPLTNDIAPGRQGAILTLADGTTRMLDSLGNGLIATQNGSNVLLRDGQLMYDGSNPVATEIAYNTVTTPNGRQFQLLLSDGTKVWLNAASSLRYPTVFTGKERRVEVTGEVYFEVNHISGSVEDPEAPMPFYVKVNEETEIEVLGTHFNINSYRNEGSINTTLLEGSVRIINKGGKAVLKPGQQAQIISSVPKAPETAIKIVNDVNVEKVMAWKDGVFDFQDATLEEVMRQLERWYDIEVVYEKGIPKLEFMGKMGRDLALSNVLRGLEVSKVHFRIEGRRLVVLP